MNPGPRCGNLGGTDRGADGRPGFAALRLGDLVIDPPVVLAPMAGVTNAPFRTLCRRFGPALYVSEMLTARGLVERNRKTLALARFAPGEEPRSIQLYATEPRTLEEAARFAVAELGARHLDLNLGCPVRKVTSSGGGAAIPLRPRLLAALLGALRRGADGRPFTVKMRLGIDEMRLTYRTAGSIAEAEGAAAVLLHARTAEQLYDGDARWERIGDLKQRLSIPVLGNGDLFEASDAVRMMRETGCDGVVIGRGCLGRPWLFGELAALFQGREPPPPPRFAAIRATALAHARALIEFFGEEIGVRHMRKHLCWYTKGFPGGNALRARASRVSSLEEIEEVLATIPPETPYPTAALRARRAKRSGRRRVALPPGWERDEGPIPCLGNEVVADGG